MPIGGGGLVSGVAAALKETRPGIRIVGVEPYLQHKIQGLKNMKESYVPGIFDRHALDRIIHVKDEDAFEMARRLAREEGIFAGFSSGASVAAALQLLKKDHRGKTIAVLLPDSGLKYLSTDLWE